MTPQNPGKEMEGWRRLSAPFFNNYFVSYKEFNKIFQYLLYFGLLLDDANNYSKSFSTKIGEHPKIFEKSWKDWHRLQAPYPGQVLKNVFVINCSDYKNTNPNDFFSL